MLPMVRKVSYACSAFQTTTQVSKNWVQWNPNQNWEPSKASNTFRASTPTGTSTHDISSSFCRIDFWISDNIPDVTDVFKPLKKKINSSLKSPQMQKRRFRTSYSPLRLPI